MTTPPPAGTPIGPLGFIPRAASPGNATWEYRVQREHFNPNGALHGGVMMALLDTAMGHAVAALVAGDGMFNAAAQMNVHFLEPVMSGIITARAEVRRCGKRLAVVEATATDEQGAVLAIASATHSLLKKPAAAPPAPAPGRS